MLSWNIQFSAGRRCLFFYDGGRDSRVTAQEVQETLKGITTLIRRHDPDIVLLQEVDRHSARTANIDQHAHLRRTLGLPCSASTPYFRVPFVPVPPHAPMGHVEMHLSVFSRFRLQTGRRIRLAPLDEPVWRRAFNLRRALLHLPMPTEDGDVLDLFTTHLSAFSRGDGTLDKQVQTVLGATSASPRMLLTGDFNCLPPDDPPQRLGYASALYADDHNPIRPLFDALDPLCPPEGALLDDPFRSYVPWGSDRPDRTIDYVLGRALHVHEVRVDPEGARFSDHLPSIVDFSIGGSNVSASRSVEGVP